MSESVSNERRRRSRSRRPLNNLEKSTPIEKKYLVFLSALRHCNKEQRTALLRTADKKLIKYICECALNVLSGVVSLKNCEKKKLKKYKNILRNLASKTLRKKKNSWKNKKRIIVQKGGNFLAFLLPPVLDILLNTFGN